MTSGALGRADLLRVWAELGIEAGSGEEHELARLLGFEPERRIPPPRQSLVLESEPEASRPDAPAPALTPTPPPQFEPVPFWIPREARFFASKTSTTSFEELPAAVLDGRLRSDVPSLEKPELEAWPRLWPRLFECIQWLRSGSALDQDAVVRSLSRAHVLPSLPRLRLRTWPDRVLLIVDREARLRPVFRDQATLLQQLAPWLPAGALALRVLNEGPDGPAWDPVGERHVSLAGSGKIVLALTDLGFTADASTQANWVRLARSLARDGAQALCAVVPVPPRLWDKRVAALWSAIPWESQVSDPSRQRAPWDGGSADSANPTGAERKASQAPASRDPSIDRLLTLVSPLTRIEPTLLRRVRRELGSQWSDSGSELGAWGRSGVRSDGLGLSMDRRLGMELRRRWSRVPLELRRRLIPIFRKAYDHLAEEHWHLSVLRMAAADSSLVDAELPEDLARAKQFARGLATTIDKNPPESLPRQALERLFDQVEQSAPDAVAAHRELGLAWQVVHSTDGSGEAPPSAVIQDYVALTRKFGRQRFVVAQHGDQLLVHSEKVALGVPLVSLDSTADTLAFSRGEDRQRSGNPESRPEWADDAGTDAQGRWASIRVGEVSARLRWIPPGIFRMGSPESEAGREDYEGPQHLVRISRGYWLGEHACTQALWESLMGENPSRYEDPKRPVESVSWYETQEFMKRLNERLCEEGSQEEFRLPTEAEWEYACRAGSEAATYGGNLTLLGTYHAPELDAIAWYGGNSGVSAEVENAWNSSRWPEKQEAHDLAASHQVGEKQANGWGLYDMLGNVYEWCLDGRRDYAEEDKVDPLGQLDGPFRVIRGGSWLSYARGVRAAFRSWTAPVNRFENLGFRLARGHRAPSQLEVAEPPKQEEDSSSRASGTRARPKESGWRTSHGKPQSSTPQTWHVEADQARGFEAQPGSLRVASDLMQVRFERFVRPPWAAEVGRDRFGLWVGMEIESELYRLRWIPPGVFRMGSPEGEAGRVDYEGPQHLVRISRGYWLGEHACTQSLWESLMEYNPSEYKDPKRPVETVSWYETQEFMKRLNERLCEEGSQDEFRLPSEAEWEYACRAGSEEATYGGNLTLLGERHAPELDAIAWYGGNSGVGPEVENAGDSSGWREKQEAHDRAASHRVGEKQANGWGLYDMLGNVYEWCLDGKRDYAEEDEVDPVGPLGGPYRVIRGGSWLSYARYVRAAYRNWLAPVYRYEDLGFRLARGHCAPGQQRAAEQPVQDREPRAGTGGAGDGEGASEIRS